MRIAFWTLLDCTIILLIACIYCHYSWKELIFTPLCASYYHQILTAHFLSCLWIWFPTSFKCYHHPAKGEGKKEKEIINTKFRFQAGFDSISVVTLDRDAVWRIHGDSGSAVPLSQKKPRLTSLHTGQMGWIWNLCGCFHLKVNTLNSVTLKKNEKLMTKTERSNETLPHPLRIKHKAWAVPPHLPHSLFLLLHLAHHCSLNRRNICSP